MSDTRVATVGPKGRVVLPVAVRREHGWDEGTVLLFVETDQGTVVTTREQALADVRKALADAPSLADDLLVQRRAEAARENAL